MTKPRSTAVTAALLCALLLCEGAGVSSASGQTSPARKQGPAPPEAPVNTEGYLLSAGDVIDVKFVYNPEMNESIGLRPDGSFALPMIGEVHASGLSPMALSQSLTERYKASLRHPEIIINVREFAGQRIYVGGEVQNPGVIGLRGRFTFLNAVFSAGGVKATARGRQILLVRQAGGNNVVVQRINLNNVLKGKIPDIELKPYDVVFVPKTPIARAGQFVDQYLNSLVPRALAFPYNLNNTISVQ